jgi:hypothetical protein
MRLLATGIDEADEIVSDSENGHQSSSSSSSASSSSSSSSGGPPRRRRRNLSNQQRLSLSEFTRQRKLQLVEAAAHATANKINGSSSSSSGKSSSGEGGVSMLGKRQFDAAAAEGAAATTVPGAAVQPPQWDLLRHSFWQRHRLQQLRCRFSRLVGSVADQVSMDAAQRGAVMPAILSELDALRAHVHDSGQNNTNSNAAAEDRSLHREFCRLLLAEVRRVSPFPALSVVLTKRLERRD